MSAADLFVPLPFDPARGVPQTVPAEVGGHHLRVTLALAATDLPALVATSPTATLVDVGAHGLRRRAKVPADESDRFRSPAPATLSADVLRPVLMVREADHLLGVRLALAGTVLRFGSVEQGGLVAEARVDTLVLPAGSLVNPGALGGSIRIGVRSPHPTTAILRVRPLSTEELYAALT